MDDLSNMVCLDIFLESLSQEEYLKVKDRIVPAKLNLHPLLSADIYLRKFQENKENDTFVQDLISLQRFNHRYKWDADIKTILEENVFQALVLTDSSQVIKWVNFGFTEMTGYKSSFAIGKTPKFLQGKNTSLETQEIIRDHLEMKKPFKQTVLNYTKNNEEYFCELNVFPLSDQSGEVVHFLALESEI